MPTYRMNYATAPLATESEYYGSLSRKYGFGFSTTTYAMHGRDFDDKYLGGDLNDYIRGKAGNDYLHGLGGDDFLFGGDGSDVISGGAGNDYLIGDSELDLLGHDKLYGGDGQDYLFGGLGQNVLDGGDGIDTVEYGWIDTGGITVNLEKTSFQHIAPDVLDKLVSVEGINGTTYNDTLIGNNEDNVFYGDSGNDTIHGKGGNDDIYGGDGNDVISGGDGDDFLMGDSYHYEPSYFYVTGDDKLYGGDGDDLLQGGMGQDVLYGGDGDDFIIGCVWRDDYSSQVDEILWELDSNKLYGGDGNDVLVIGSNNDRLEGGAGTDIFLFEGLYGSSDTIRIVDFNPDENDKIAFFKDAVDTSLEDFYESFIVSSNVRQDGNDTYIEFLGSTQVLLEDVRFDSLTADDFIVFLIDIQTCTTQ